MKVLFKKYCLNPTITGAVHTSAGKIDIESLSEETLEILFNEGYLEGHITLIQPIEDDTEAQKDDENQKPVKPKPATK